MRDISGLVTTAIEQLPATPGADKPGLKELLQQLKFAVEGDGKLNQKEKSLALRKVGELAEAAHYPHERVNKLHAKGVVTMLGELTKNFNEATNFGEACHKYLPVILKFFE